MKPLEPPVASLSGVRNGSEPDVVWGAGGIDDWGWNALASGLSGMRAEAKLDRSLTDSAPVAVLPGGDSI
jgi:hypothetical protein